MKTTSDLQGTVLLSQPIMPDAKTIFSHLCAQWPKMSQVTDCVESHDSIQFNFCGRAGKIRLIREPVPWEELEGACASSPFWPKERNEALCKHKAHLVVSHHCLYPEIEKDGQIIPLFRLIDLFRGTSPELHKLNRVVFLSRLVAAVAEISPALGVYWEAGTLVHHPIGFQKACQLGAKSSSSHLLTWISFLVEEQPDDHVHASTKGLQALGCLEMAVLQSQRSVKEVKEILVACADYILLHQKKWKDGDSIPIIKPKREKIPISIMAPTSGRSQVMILHL